MTKDQTFVGLNDKPEKEKQQDWFTSTVQILITEFNVFKY